MNKLSCKIGDFASSVIVLKDGRAMEVRRGKETRFRDLERTYWASVDAWKATLPEGGIAAIKGETETESTSSSESGSTSKVHAGETKPKPKSVKGTRKIVNTVLENFLAKLSNFHGSGRQRSNCYRSGTHRIWIETDIADNKRKINDVKFGRAHPCLLSLYEENLAKSEKLLAKLIEDCTADDETYITTEKSHFMTLTADGEIFPVYYNLADKRIFYKERTKEYLTPLTNPDALFWYATECVSLLSI